MVLVVVMLVLVVLMMLMVVMLGDSGRCCRRRQRQVHMVFYVLEGIFGACSRRSRHGSSLHLGLQGFDLALIRQRGAIQMQVPETGGGEWV